MIYALISVFIISLTAFIGAISLALSDKILKKIIIYLVAFSAGGLMGGAFFHLIPESLESFQDSSLLFIYVLIGFSIFFILEKVLRWHHCHEPECKAHKHLGWINLIGDGVHNLIDGIIVFAAYMVGPELGIPVTISIIFHEVPQELGDFGVLIYSGFSKSRALLYNFISALFAVLGVFVGYFLIQLGMCHTCYLLPIAAGGFIYISASDLIPEIHKQENNLAAIISFVIFLIALIMMYLLKLIGE